MPTDRRLLNSVRHLPYRRRDSARLRHVVKQLEVMQIRQRLGHGTAHSNFPMVPAISTPLPAGHLNFHGDLFSIVHPSPSAPVIVRYDGSCLFCSRSVQLVAHLDRHDRVRFRALENGQDAGTMQLEIGDAILEHSDAVLALLSTLGAPWSAIAKGASFIPRSLRDAAYRWIARHRHHFKSRHCSVPDEEVRRRMLHADP
ncbi:putative DCC family thiol-disulfide oxidoreductase YuxK [Haloferula luteola]|uniref:Putative DCC family thiol-disulfide oxidoreductase YuxK n=1 Tax=Haloferula luteola TaxID=595692 RepID=A0A840V4V9_9BACT|nr:DCC1-like thiol-disulfide oxidoreductase family protein [Haloferula luteola]MBB5353055.1 putative DCC family thiol-disulfide oxidoreductase YuxK [Haloferula luteola]